MGVGKEASLHVRISLTTSLGNQEETKRNTGSKTSAETLNSNLCFKTKPPTIHPGFRNPLWHYRDLLLQKDAALIQLRRFLFTPLPFLSPTRRAQKSLRYLGVPCLDVGRLLDLERNSLRQPR